MNKLLMIFFLMLGIMSPLIAELKQDPATFRYYSMPSSRDINQNEYHQLVWTCKDILKNYAQKHAVFWAQYPDAVMSSAYDPNNQASQNAVIEYL